MLTFKQFLEEEKRSEYVRSSLDVNFINLLNDYSVNAFQNNINSFTSYFDNDSAIVFMWDVNDFGNLLSIDGMVSKVNTIDSIRLTSWNVENISRILLDSGLLINSNKQDLLKEKLRFQNQTANDWLSYGYEFTKPNDKYLMWIVASELNNGYNLGLRKDEKAAKVIETEKGYTVIIKPTGTDCYSPIVVIVRMEDNILNIEISYNFLDRFFIRVDESNFSEFTKNFRIGVEKFLASNNVDEFTNRLNWFGYSKLDKNARKLESGGF